VKVLRVEAGENDKQKIALGLKQLMEDPWSKVSDAYAVGQVHTGRVTRVTDFGAFVELEPGIEGLIHISELSPSRVRRVIDVVKPEQEVEVRILKVDPDEKKIALSLIPLPSAAVAEPEEEEDDEPRPPRPEPKVPLKGGLGDRDPFLQMPKGKS